MAKETRIDQPAYVPVFVKRVNRGHIVIRQFDDWTIRLVPEAIPALIKALQAAAKGAGNE